jgi:hypothetical protein
VVHRASLEVACAGAPDRSDFVNRKQAIPDRQMRGCPFPGQKRSNETHASTTDPEARLYRKGSGKEAKLCFMGRALMENRNRLIVDACLTEANGHAERIAALHMTEPRADRPRPITLGADKGYDAEDFVNELRSMNATPTWRRTPAAARRRSTAARRGTRAMRSANVSASGSRKPSAGSRRSPARSEPSSAAASASDGSFTFAAAAYNLARLPKLLEASA